MSKESVKNIPTVFIILGSTGDLAERKIFPSLYSLYKKEKLPKLLRVIGFSRREWNDDRFREFVSESIRKKSEDEEIDEEFLNTITYQEGDFRNLKDFKQFAEILGNIDGKWQVCSNKLFYLAVPPKYYEDIFNNLSESHLTDPCSPEEGWTRVIVEKPFGKDLKTAKKLDSLLSELFKEEQIFRVDHYLGKDMLQNILAFRFSNNIFENSWNAKYIDSIEIKLLETGGVSDRGNFYDGVGALRDVGQNHLLQMLALTTMDNPESYDPEAIRGEREKLLKELKPLNSIRIKNETFRAQYVGYQDVEGVKDASNTETYFKTTAYLDKPRWRGVRITLEAGKAMQEQKKEVVVRYKHPHPCLCPPSSDHSSHNKVIFAIEPEEEITFRLWYKRPGYELEMEKRSFDLPYRVKSQRVQYTEEYERLLLDCFSGDQTLFITSSEVESMWRYTDPIVSAWNKNEVQLHTYKKGEEDIRVQANDFVSLAAGQQLRREIGVVGLGKMGSAIAENLMEQGWKVVGYNRSDETTKEMEKHGLVGTYSLKELVGELPRPRVVWLMVPAGSPVADTVKELANLLDEGDVVIDGGNSFYKESVKNAEVLEKEGIEFVDVGVSGGPNGARYGACLMVGGKSNTYDKLLPLFVDLSVIEGHEHFEGSGAGHFVKMVHNGIEYGMMQAVAEGFDILKNSDYKLHLRNVARIYNNGSVIESRLIDWMKEAFEVFGDDLGEVSGAAGGGGKAPGEIENSEGVWSTKVAHAIGVEDEVIHQALNARKDSIKDPNFQGKIINALRNRFGGHSVKSERSD